MTKNVRLSRLADQAGFAMPVVVAVSALLLLVATAAVTSGLNATTSANEDRQVKLARQAADSGMEMALFHLNRIAAGETLPCVSRDDASGNYAMANYAAGNQWCAPVTETLADGSTMSYTISAEQPQANTSPEQVVRKIVATGTYLGEQRRVYTELLAVRGVINGGVYGITARDQVMFENFATAGSTTDTVHVRTNGDIIMKNSAQICGNATPGPGKTVTMEQPQQNICDGFSTAPAATPLPPETFYDYGPEHDAAWITNDNSRLGCTPAGPAKDACTQPSGITWDASKRELIVGNNSTLTLSGSVYSLCRLNLKNGSRVYIAPRPSGSPIRFYFNSPDKCFGQTENIMIENGWGITNNNTDPTSLQFFVRGSTSETTKVIIKNNAQGAAATPMLIHAPNSEILLENNAGMFGTLVGKTVHLKNSSLIANDPNPDDDDQSAALVYQPTGHRECSPVPSGTPDSGC